MDTQLISTSDSLVKLFLNCIREYIQINSIQRDVRPQSYITHCFPKLKIKYCSRLTVFSHFLAQVHQTTSILRRITYHFHETSSLNYLLSTHQGIKERLSQETFVKNPHSHATIYVLYSEQIWFGKLLHFSIHNPFKLMTVLNIELVH